MTVGKAHDINGSAPEILEKLRGKGVNRLYFVVPPLYYDKLIKQKPTSIDQFALLIPNPEAIPDLDNLMKEESKVSVLETMTPAVTRKAASDAELMETKPSSVH